MGYSEFSTRIISFFHLVSFRTCFGIFYLYLRSFSKILNRVQDDSLRVLFRTCFGIFYLCFAFFPKILKRVQDDWLCVLFRILSCHSEFSSESFTCPRGSFQRSWNKFRMIGCVCYFVSSRVIPNLFWNLLLVPRLPSKDPETSSGWMVGEWMTDCGDGWQPEGRTMSSSI